MGASTCMGCHTDKAEAFKKTGHGKKLPVVKNIPFEKSCETCHGAGGEHVNAGGDKTAAGFDTVSKAVKSSETCLKCHKGGETKFWGVSAHDQAGMDCTKCHSVHEGKGPENLALSKTETCLQCHKKQRMEAQLPAHHPVLEGRMNCTDCHNPHGGPSGNIKAESVNELCYKCHAEKAGPFQFEHPPVAENCLTCHYPHGSQNKRMLNRPQWAICQSCHVQPHYDNAVTMGIQRVIDYGQCQNCHTEIHGSDRRHRFNPR